MRRLAIFSFTLTFAALGTAALFAQRPARDDEDRPRREDRRAERGPDDRGPGRLRGPGRPGGPLRIPLLAALDADRDGVISTDEINNAVQSLQSLDKNNDGKLTRDEMMPPPPEGRPGDGRLRGPEGRLGEGRGRAERERPSPAAMLERLMANDKDQDGKLSKDEMPERMQRIFKRADANADGFLDQEEIKVVLERRISQLGGPGREGAGRRGEGQRGARGDRPPRDRRPQAEE